MKQTSSFKRFEYAYEFIGEPPLSFQILFIVAVSNTVLWSFGDLILSALPSSSLLGFWIDHSMELTLLSVAGLCLIAFLHRDRLVRVPTPDPRPATPRDVAAIAVAVFVFFLTRGWIELDMPNVQIWGADVGKKPATRLDVVGAATVAPLYMTFVGAIVVFPIYIEVSRLWGVIAGIGVIGLAPLITLRLLASGPPPRLTAAQRLFVVVWASAVSAATLAFMRSLFRAA